MSDTVAVHTFDTPDGKGAIQFTRVDFPGPADNAILMMRLIQDDKASPWAAIPPDDEAEIEAVWVGEGAFHFENSAPLAGTEITLTVVRGDVEDGNLLADPNGEWVGFSILVNRDLATGWGFTLHRATTARHLYDAFKEAEKPVAFTSMEYNSEAMGLALARAATDPARAEYATTYGQRLRAAKERMARGIGQRSFYVMVNGSKNVIEWDVTDELTVLARQGLRDAAAFYHEAGKPDITPDQCCMHGLHALREIVKAGGPSENTADRRQGQTGMAELALLRLYDDMVLRNYTPSDEPAIYWSKGPALPPSGPPNAYWLMLSNDGEVPTFSLLLQPPPQAQDGSHRVIAMRTLH